MATLSYEEFGKRFVEMVVTADRVEATLKNVVAGAFETGVRMAGGIVKADGSGQVTRLEVDRVEGEDLAYRANIFVEMALAVRISGVPYRYEGWGRVTLDLLPVLNKDLSIFIKVPDVSSSDIVLELRPLGRIAGILDQLGGVNEQVQREIVKFVNDQKDAPEALEARRIDIAETIDAEWERRQSRD